MVIEARLFDRAVRQALPLRKVRFASKGALHRSYRAANMGVSEHTTSREDPRVIAT